MSLLFSRRRGQSQGLGKLGGKRDPGRNRRTLSLEMMEARTLLTSGTITPLVNQAPNGVTTMELLTNGDLLGQGADNGEVSNDYWLFTPDSKGNYVDGTWTQVASSDLDRLYCGTVVLPNGNVLVVGGEYSGPSGQENDTNEGEIYNPNTNTWTVISTYPQANFGDDELVNLGNGLVLAGYLGGPQTYIYNANTNTWSETGTKLYGDQSDEENYVELPDGSFLDYDIFSSLSTGTITAQRYVPSTGTWVAAGTLPEQLSETSEYELGGGLLLPNGQVFQIGGNGNTAYYTPSSNTWTAGPVMPNSQVQDDGPTAEADNGVILISGDTLGYAGPTDIYEYNPTTQVYTDISSEFPSGFNQYGCYIDRMLDLPNGQIMITNGGTQVLYTPATAALSSNIPTISSITANPSGGFTLTGTGINGNSDGAVYGDDAQMATNYPIISLTNTAGNVFYATTSNFNYQVEQGSKLLSTNFTVPAGLQTGSYQLRVIANGAASAPTTLSFSGPTIKVPATATPNPVFSTTTQLSVLGADPSGESTLKYTWSTVSSPAGAAVPTFSINGTNASKNDTATFHAVGNYTLEVTVTDQLGLSVVSTVNVTVDPTLASFSLSPTKAQLSPNQTEQFLATGVDQFGNAITTSANFTWSVAGGGGTINQTGLYTAPAAGTIATVKVTTGTASLTSTVYVLSNPWTDSDIGAPAIGGNAADNGAGTFTLLGAGTGIGGTADQAQFTYLSLPGNSTIEAQVSSLINTNSAAEAGIAYRNGLNPGDMNVTLGITPSSGLVYSYRNQTNGTTISLTIPRITAGDYLKLVRVGNIFTGYYSINGTTWTQAGAAVNLALNSTALGGLITTSSNVSALNTSVFSHVLADANPTVVIAAAANPNPVLTTTTTKLSVLGGDAAGEPALTYTWATTVNASGAVTPTFATNGTNASKNDVVTFYKAGTYTFTVTIANALGYSTTSSVTVLVESAATSTVLTPTSAIVMEGHTQLFTAEVVDQFGNKVGVQPHFTFSMIAGGAGGKVSSSGLYTAPERTGIDYVNVTGNGTAAVAQVTVVPAVILPSAAPSAPSAPATVGAVSVGWGVDSAPLFTAADGLRLLPAGRVTDLPWSGIDSLKVTLSKSETLTPSNVTVMGITVANYGPVSITPIAGSPGTYVIALAKPINSADRVTVVISSPNIATYVRRLDVLPGDVNDDGVVNQSDAAIASSYVLSLYLPADIFGDGVVSQRSVKAIQLLNGTTLPLQS